MEQQRNVTKNGVSKMIIKKVLKNVMFDYDTNRKILCVSREHVDEANQTGCLEYMNISRIEMFSLARFILRIAQKGNAKK